MRLLLDTHILLWAIMSPDRLSAAEASAIRDPTNEVFVSVASLWELAIKASLGRLMIPPRLIETLAATRIQMLMIEIDHALNVAHLPSLHKDSFDRILVAQAMHEGLTLVTRDPWVAAYPVATHRA